jgi:NADH-dependent peroxiredoxin subunit F
MKSSNEMTLLDTLIIGAGIAGMTAAVYASRKRMNYKIVGETLGGQLLQTAEILNYPGIVKTTGAEMQRTLKMQAEYNNIEVIGDKATEIERKGRFFSVEAGGKKYKTKSVIAATGARPRKLNIPGEKEYTNKGLTYCSICDGPLFSGLDVAVVGGGNAALEAVDFMKEIAGKIYVVTDENDFRAYEYLQERALNSKKVNPIYGAKVTEVLGDKLVTGLKITVDGSQKTLDVGGVIVEIGRTPNTELFSSLLELDSDGHIVIDCMTQTTMPGVFAAGDCASGHEYQYTIAAGQGCMALIKAARYLNTLGED